MGCDENHIFYSNASPIREVDAGLYRKDHPLLHRSFILAVDHWVLMNGKAGAVTKSMAEIFPISLISNMIPCCGVHLADGYAWPNLLNCLVVGFFHDSIDFLLLRRGAAANNGAGLIGMLALEL